MKDYNKNLRNRFKKCKDIDKLIEKLSKNNDFIIKKLTWEDFKHIEYEVKTFYSLEEIKIYKITQKDKGNITILYRNYNEKELQEIKDLKKRELEEMGATGVELFKNEIIRIYY